MARTLRPCGTNAAYARHLLHGETPCQPCKDAHTEYVSRSETAQQCSRARQRALVRLAAAFPDEYRPLLAAERETEPDAGRTGYARARRRALTRLSHARDVEYQVLLVQEMDAEQENA